MNTGYAAPSVRKAFDILYTIAESKTGLSISELSRALKIGKSTVHGITLALEDIGAIMRDPSTKRYKLGISIIELARWAYTHVDLREIARPSMVKLMEKVQETVFLGVLNKDNVTVLDIVESEHAVKITSTIGQTNPILGGVHGKAILGGMEEERIKSIIRSKGLKNYTENSITDTQKFLEEIRKIKKQGYAIDDEEYISGSYAVGSPIQGLGHMIAAIYVVGLKPRMENKKKLLIKETMAAAEEIRLKSRQSYM